MSAHDVTLFGDQIAAERLAAKFTTVDAQKLMRLAIEDLFPGHIALVSSFGADSAVLLHMASEIDKALPVVFVDTLHLFPETLAYRDALIDRLGLTHVDTSEPDKKALAEADPENFLWATDPDRCCELRKVAPLSKALEGYEAWITGRKRFQTLNRASLPLFETEGDRVKINPLAGWTRNRIEDYFKAHDLPRHPLVEKNFLSIGCIPCTSPVQPGEDARAGRWRGRAKTECGIHVQTLDAGSDI
ncbi:MAG TPA: phosphoadenylyl-sulfate reductase [Methylovirgula sp.]